MIQSSSDGTDVRIFWERRRHRRIDVPIQSNVYYQPLSLLNSECSPRPTVEIK